MQYYSQKETKEKFNANTAFTYSVKLNDDELYKDKYKFLKVLVLQKRDRGFVELYCFYTDDGAKELEKYWALLENAFRYED